MKLTIKKKWFDKIKNYDKIYEFRDAHLTLVCEETGETLKRKIRSVDKVNRAVTHYSLNKDLENDDEFNDMFSDKYQIRFRLR